MTKIKNFRITLRSREVARLLKTQQHVQITPALETSIEHAIGEVKRSLQPAAVYTTLSRSIAERTTAIPLPDNAVSVSILAVTIGPALLEEASAAEAKHDALQGGMLKALAQEALHQAVQFIARLIADQAKDEECEVSAATETNDVELQNALASLLGGQRIGIQFEKDPSRLPAHSRLVWLVWTPVARAAKSSKPAGRSEKAAV